METSSLMEGLQALLAQFRQNPASPTQAVWAMVTEVHSSLFIEIDQETKITESI